jgi:hypothetical protein
LGCSESARSSRLTFAQRLHAFVRLIRRLRQRWLLRVRLIWRLWQRWLPGALRVRRCSWIGQRRFESLVWVGSRVVDHEMSPREMGPSGRCGDHPIAGWAATTSRHALTLPTQLVRPAPGPPGAGARKAFLQAALRRPPSKLITRTTNPTTSSKWIKPPPTCKLKPRSHKIRRTTRMVQSMSNLLCSLASTQNIMMDCAPARTDSRRLNDKQR